MPLTSSVSMRLLTKSLAAVAIMAMRSMEQVGPARLHHRAEEHDRDERDGNEHLPAEAHDLVVAIAGERGADPEEEEEQREHLREEPEEAVSEGIRAEHLDMIQDRPRRQPAAEEHRRG